MGQKVNPIGFRLVINKDWDSKWFAKNDYADNLHEDLKIRNYINKTLKHAGIGRVIIQRIADRINVKIYTARPGIVIGKKGVGVEKLNKELKKFTNKILNISIIEIKKPELNAKLLGEYVAAQIERRVAFRRAMKRAISMAKKAGALGVRIKCSGRLAGAEMARSEWYVDGSIPLHTLRANIDYALVEALTKYGVIGIKVWIYKSS